MKQRRDNTLRKELRSVGATEAEAGDLTTLAASLKGLERIPDKRMQPNRPRWRAFVPAGATGLAGLFIGAALVSFAQTSLPGSLLYPVKTASEHVAAAIYPDYKGTLMMRRAEEVKQLVASNSSPKLVTAALHNYRVQAMAYKAKNYAAFDYCKRNLVQAEAIASGAEKQSIALAIAEIKTDDD